MHTENHVFSVFFDAAFLPQHTEHYTIANSFPLFNNNHFYFCLHSYSPSLSFDVHICYGQITFHSLSQKTIAQHRHTSRQIENKKSHFSTFLQATSFQLRIIKHIHPKTNNTVVICLFYNSQIYS